ELAIPGATVRARIVQSRKRRCCRAQAAPARPAMKRLVRNKVPVAEPHCLCAVSSNPAANMGAKMTTLGQTRWAIAEGYIPAQSSFSDPALVSHETACILNAGDKPAHVRITIFFPDREPVGPYVVTVPPRRTLHVHFNDLERPEPIPRDTPYSSLLESVLSS